MYVTPAPPCWLCATVAPGLALLYDTGHGVVGEVHMGVIYLPVPSAESRKMAADFNAGRVAKGKDPHRVLECLFTSGGKRARRKLGFGAMRSVVPAEKLYILLHGVTDIAGLNSPAKRAGMARDATRGRSALVEDDGTNWK